MALATNIVSRRGTYYVRVAMPVDLQVDGGPKEVWRSLRTKDRRDAKSLAAGVVGGLLAEWDGVRGGDKVFHWSGGDLRLRRGKIQPVVRHSFVLGTKGSRRDVCRGGLRGGSTVCFQ